MAYLSAVVITYNEATNIERCLHSLQPVADQLLVVDSYSTDETVTLAEQAGADVCYHTFRSHIDQKNYAMRAARYDHILSLDADEALTPELQASIMREKANELPCAYTVKRLTNYCGQWIYHCGWYPDKKLRLWHRHYGSWGGVNPHDKVVLQPEVKQATLEGHLLHYSFPSIESHVSTSNKFSTIVAQERYQQQRPPSLLLNVLLNPVFTFWKKYLLQGGFRDGFYGFVICLISSYYNFLKYAKAWALFYC
jgi:glycosyltransferase involved in cell wall biosynthesis